MDGGLGGGFSMVSTIFSDLDGAHGQGMAMNLGTSSPGINTGKLSPLFFFIS